MKKILLILSGILVVLLVAVGISHFYGLQNLSKKEIGQFSTIIVSDYKTTIDRGLHLATISSCNGCHGLDFQGKDFIKEAPIGYVPAPNLTPSGPTADYSDDDWVRAIRHGVAKDGRVMVIMPSHHYSVYGDDDLAELIAYLKNLPVAENKFDHRDIQFPGSIIFGILAYDSWPANMIDHSKVGGEMAPSFEDPVTYGKYITKITGCYECHGENLAGKDPESEGAPGPNITRSGNPGDWDFAQFKKVMQTGQTPEGKVLNPEKMPWPNYSVMTDTELIALWTHIKSI